MSLFILIVRKGENPAIIYTHTHTLAITHTQASARTHTHKCTHTHTSKQIHTHTHRHMQNGDSGLQLGL